MKKFLALLIFLSLPINAQSAFTNYRAEIRDLEASNGPILFTTTATKKLNGQKLLIEAQSLDAKGVVAIKETAEIDKDSSEILTYKIVNNQTKESGDVSVASKVRIEYKAEGKDPVVKEFDKPKRLVAPANFEYWIIKNFEEIKKEKSVVVDFLIWDRLETIKFKVSYLGEKTLNGEKTQLFKMNINNFVFAAFIDPIQIWYNMDMTQIRQYEGRVSPRKNVNGSLKDLDGRAVYTYELVK